MLAEHLRGGDHPDSIPLPSDEAQPFKLGPPTVYRALDFLLAHRLIHKLESVSAFVACDDVEHPHESQFMICDDCGAAEEIHYDAIVQSLRQLGEDRGFSVARPVIEARGMCPTCRAAAHR